MTCECGNIQYHSITQIIKALAMYKTDADFNKYNLKDDIEPAGNYFSKLLKAGIVK